MSSRRVRSSLPMVRRRRPIAPPPPPPRRPPPGCLPLRAPLDVEPARAQLLADGAPSAAELAPHALHLAVDVLHRRLESIEPLLEDAGLCHGISPFLLRLTGPAHRGGPGTAARDDNTPRQRVNPARAAHENRFQSSGFRPRLRHERESG